MNTKPFLFILVVFCFMQSLIACAEGEYENVGEASVDIFIHADSIDSSQTDTTTKTPSDSDTLKNTNITEKGITKTIKYSTKIIGKDIIKGNSYSLNGMNLTGQGVAIYKNYMFRLYHSGYCCIYDLSDINNIKPINSYALGSYSLSNHANCAQFANDTTETGFPLLYVSYNSSSTKCVVEKVSLSGSEIVRDYIGIGQIPNVIIGDDNYLWGIGSNSGNRNDYHLIFWKHNLTHEGNLDFNENSTSAIDVFTDKSDNIPRTWQGAKVKNGKIYFLLGATGKEAQIRIYDVKTHERIGIIDLSNVTSAEPEDIDIWQENNIILTLNGTNYAILIEFEDNPYIP